MKKKIIAFAACLSVIASLQAKDVLLSKEGNSLYIKKGELILLNFPFKIKSDKDIEVFGNRKAVDVKFKDKSIYFVTSMLPLKMLVYGGDKPIYLTFNRGKNKSAKTFDLKASPGVSVDTNLECSDTKDDKIVSFVRNISIDGVFTGSGYYEEKVGTIDVKDGIEINHISRYKSSGFDVDYYKVTNRTLGRYDLRINNDFSGDESVIANLFGNGNGVLEYNWSTWVYVFRNPIKASDGK